MTTPTKLVKLLTGKIFEIRGEKVILDFDAAALYEVDPDELNKRIRRNIKRFPADFMFRLSPAEWETVCKNFPREFHDAMPRPPLAFTNSGLFMLSGILKSKRAAELSVMIIESLFYFKNNP